MIPDSFPLPPSKSRRRGIVLSGMSLPRYCRTLRVRNPIRVESK
jgi:hypothetical protein